MNFLYVAESVLSKYPSIINALTAIGTLGAIIAALYLARMQNRPLIKGEITRKIMLEQNESQEIVQNDNAEYLTLELNNLGSIPIYLHGCNGFVYSFPFGKLDIINPPLSPECLNENLVLDAYSSKIILLSKTDAFIEAVKEYCREHNYPKFLVNFIKFNINTSTNYTFKIKINKNVITHIIRHL